MNTDAFTQLFSWQFILFSLGMFVITWFIRTVVEYFVPNAGNSKLWTELLLPIMPPITGAVVSYFATTYAYPLGLSTTSGRLLFGSVSGMFSGFVYRVAKGLLKDKIASFVSSTGDTSANTAQVIPFPTAPAQPTIGTVPNTQVVPFPSSNTP